MEVKQEKIDVVVVSEDSDEAPLPPAPPRNQGSRSSTNDPPRRATGITFPMLVFGPRERATPNGSRRGPPFRFESATGSVVWEVKVEDTRQVYVRKWVYGCRDWQERSARIVEAYSNVEESWQTEEPAHFHPYASYGRGLRRPY